jgi:hypothetical protein
MIWNRARPFCVPRARVSSAQPPPGAVSMVIHGSSGRAGWLRQTQNAERTNQAPCKTIRNGPRSMSSPAGRPFQRGSAKPTGR